MGRRKIIFMLAPLVSIFGAAMAIYLKVAPNPNWTIVLSLGGALISCAFLGSYYANIKLLPDPSVSSLLFFESIGQTIIDRGGANKIEVRLKIRAVYHPVRWGFCRRYFRVRWGLPPIADGAIEFHVDKGVAGEAFKKKKSVLVNMEEEEVKRANWGFTEQERSSIPDYTMLWAYPIFELNKYGTVTSTIFGDPKIIGILNVSSTTPGAFSTLSEDHQFTELVEDFRQFVCRVASC